MANLKVCDVCKAEGKIVESRWRVGYKQPHMKLDTCDKHKDVAKGKTPEQWDKHCLDLMYGKEQ